jgi:hypothetical protein
MVSMYMSWALVSSYRIGGAVRTASCMRWCVLGGDAARGADGARGASATPALMARPAPPPPSRPAPHRRPAKSSRQAARAAASSRRRRPSRWGAVPGAGPGAPALNWGPRPAALLPATPRPSSAWGRCIHPAQPPFGRGGGSFHQCQHRHLLHFFGPDQSVVDAWPAQDACSAARPVKGRAHLPHPNEAPAVRPPVVCAAARPQGTLAPPQPCPSPFEPPTPPHPT